MNRQQKLETLDRLEQNAAIAYFEQLRQTAPVSRLIPGTEELLTVSMPASVGEEALRCRQVGCTSLEIRAAVSLARGIAIDNFRRFLSLIRDTA